MDTNQEIPSEEIVSPNGNHDQNASKKTLCLAWERFALYDDNAKRQQKSFRRVQFWILMLGVLATLLVLIKKEFIVGEESIREWLISYAIILAPITISVLIAVANRFKAGSKWILLRASAETIKQEIYRYRSRTDIYSDENTEQTSRAAKLAAKIQMISQRVMRTDVNVSALHMYKGPIPPKMYGAGENDDGFKPLKPEDYITLRLEDQLYFYHSKTIKLEKQLKALQWLTYILGGIGTLLAAVKLELWVPLTTVLVGAFSTYLGYQQVENTLMQYNQARTDLANLQVWWTALSDKEKAIPENFDTLVRKAEKIFQTERSGWVQQMEDALEDLSEQQLDKPSGGTSETGGEEEKPPDSEEDLSGQQPETTPEETPETDDEEQEPPEPDVRD